MGKRSKKQKSSGLGSSTAAEASDPEPQAKKSKAGPSDSLPSPTEAQAHQGSASHPSESPLPDPQTSTQQLSNRKFSDTQAPEPETSVIEPAGQQPSSSAPRPVSPGATESTHGASKSLSPLPSANEMDSGEEWQDEPEPEQVAKSPRQNPVTLSNSWCPRSNSVLVTGREGEVIILLAPWETLYLQGSASALILAGKCHIFGYAMSAAEDGQNSDRNTRNVDVYAVPPYGPMALEAAGNATQALNSTLITSLGLASSQLHELVGSALASRNTAAVICLRRRNHGISANDPDCGATTDPSWVDAKAAVDRIKKEVRCTVLTGETACFQQPMKIPRDWRGAADSVLGLTSGGEGLRMAVVGAKGSGKSTMCRFICNQLLNRYTAVMVLDVDVGQSEFTPPGVLALSRVTKPLLGPPHTHIQNPEHAVHYGDVTPEEDPSLYLLAIQHLFELFESKTKENVPLIVNTCGWVKGLGFELIKDVIQSCKIRTVLTCQVGNSRKDITSGPGTWGPEVKSLSIAPLEFDGQRSSINAAELRNMQLLAYLLGGPEIGPDVAKTLAQARPFAVGLKSLSVCFMYCEVDDTETLLALNASLIGLCTFSGSKSSATDQDARVMECLGIGLIRAVDAVKKVLYILCPLPQDTVKRVNTLMRGKLEIPVAALNHQTAGRAPFLAVESLAASTGSGAMKSRSNIQRRGHQ